MDRLQPFEVEYREHMVRKVPIRYRALNTEDVTGLLTSRLAEVQMMFDSLSSLRPTAFSRDLADAFIIQVINQAPGVAAEIISRAADQKDNVEAFKTIPFAHQCIILADITAMTLEEVGGLKNLLGALNQTLQGLVPPNFLNSLTKSQSAQKRPH